MKSFEETKQMASDSLCDMKHGAVNAAAELHEKIEALENGIACETELFRMAFY